MELASTLPTLAVLSSGCELRCASHARMAPYVHLLRHSHDLGSASLAPRAHGRAFAPSGRVRSCRHACCPHRAVGAVGDPGELRSRSAGYRQAGWLSPQRELRHSASYRPLMALSTFAKASAATKAAVEGEAVLAAVSAV